MEYLSDNDLLQLSKYLDTVQWISVGKHLKIPLSNLDLISDNHKNENYTDKAYRMLLQWREMFPKECTVKHLVQALKSAELVATSLKVQQFSQTPEISSQLARRDIRGTLLDNCKVTFLLSYYCTN